MHSLQSLYEVVFGESDIHHTYICDVSQCICQQFDGFNVRCLLSMQSITSHGQIANRFWQDTSEKHYSHNNRGERSLCGVVLTKLTRPFTAFDTGLAASHNGRHINLQMSSGKLKCQRFSQQHQGPARGIIDWFTFCLAKYSFRRTKKGGKAKDERASSTVSVCWQYSSIFFWENMFFPHILQATRCSCNTYAVIHRLVM